MICPSCKQVVEEADRGNICPKCGSKIPATVPEARQMYIIFAAMVISVMIYVVMAELISKTSVIHMSEPPEILRTIFTALAVLTGPVFAILGRSMFAKATGPQDIMKIVIIQAALAETPAMYGLVLFFMGFDKMSFYVFIGFSLVYLFFLFTQLGSYAAKMFETTRDLDKAE